MSEYWRRQISRRRFVAGGATLAAGSAALLAAGCGDDNDDGGESTPGGGQGTSAAGSPASQGTSAAGSPTRAAEQPRRGGTLRSAKAEADQSIDPQVKVVNNYEMIARMYSFTHSYRLSTDEALVDAATGYEQPDPLQLTFKIRDGIKFHNIAPMNGRALTAADVAFAYNRFPRARKDLGGQISEPLWGWIDSVTAPDANTAVIKQKFPFAANLAAMGGPGYAIFAKEAIGADGFLSVPAGSGPYLLKKRDGTGTLLERNPDYFKRTNPAPTYVADGPYIDSIDTRILPDFAAQKTAFLVGDLDILNAAGVGVDALSIAEYKNNKDVVVETATPLTPIGLALDMGKLTDARVREAISLAIDRDALIANIYAGDGRYEGPVSNGLPKFAFSQAELKTYQKFDPKKAKELWAAAGSPFSTLRAVTSQNIPPWATMTDFIAKQLEANLPVKVKVEALDIGSLVSRLVESPTKQWELCVCWDTQAPSIPDYNALALYLPNAIAGLNWNFKLDSPNPDTAKLAKETQRLADAAAAAIKPEERIAKLTELQKYCLTNFAPFLSMPVAAKAYSIVRKTLRNYPHTDTPSLFQLRVQDMWIAAS